MKAKKRHHTGTLLVTSSTNHATNAATRLAVPLTRLLQNFARKVHVFCTDEVQQDLLALSRGSKMKHTRACIVPERPSPMQMICIEASDLALSSQGALRVGAFTSSGAFTWV